MPCILRFTWFWNNDLAWNKFGFGAGKTMCDILAEWKDIVEGNSWNGGWKAMINSDSQPYVNLIKIYKTEDLGVLGGEAVRV